jgi:hypothetical protein
MAGVEQRKRRVQMGDGLSEIFEASPTGFYLAVNLDAALFERRAIAVALAPVHAPS